MASTRVDPFVARDAPLCLLVVEPREEARVEEAREVEVITKTEH
jgi:hypothetical protein